MNSKEKNELIIDSVAVLIGDYHINRKYAAILLLKALLPREIAKRILEDDGIYPIDRNDPRVRKWKKIILSKGKCEICGTDKELEAHHIIRWADFPKGRIDINNGQCLCIDCHAKMHKDENIEALILSKKRRCCHVDT